MVTKARSFAPAESRVCRDGTIAFLLSLPVLLHEKLGCSQGNMLPDVEVLSEQPPKVDATAALGATMLEHKAPNR